MRKFKIRYGFTPLEKSIDKVTSGLMSTSAQTVRERSSLTGFTLIELMIVVVVIGVLATLVVPSYVLSRERLLENDAKAKLQLIVNAEKMYRYENPGSDYIACVNTVTCADNAHLRTDFGSSSDWNYYVDGVVAAPNPDCFVHADRLRGGMIRTLTLQATTTTVTCTAGACLGN